MTERREPESEAEGTPSVNPGYAAFQLAKALTTSTEHTDPVTRARAEARVARWRTVLANILSGLVNYGSRTPVADLPAWVTLDVVTGGFATGGALAGGPLQDHEKTRVASLGIVPAGEERRGLNAWHLTDAGIAEAIEQLRTGCYDIAVPEEAAMLVIAWLAARGEAEVARELLDTFSPHLRQHPRESFTRSRRRSPPAASPIPNCGSSTHRSIARSRADDRCCSSTSKSRSGSANCRGSRPSIVSAPTINPLALFRETRSPISPASR
jgi:hypothetical protein